MAAVTTSEHTAIRSDRRLGARALQVLVLIAEGRSTTEIADGLSLTTGTVKALRQTIRRYLRLPRDVALDRESIRRHVDLDAIVAHHERRDVQSRDRRPVSGDRRSAHLLRLSLTELEQLANRLTRRAALLSGLAGEDGHNPAEAAQLRHVSRSVAGLHASLLIAVRTNPPSPSSSSD